MVESLEPSIQYPDRQIPGGQEVSASDKPFRIQGPDYTYESEAYNLEVRRRGSDSFQRARKAFGKNRPDILMGYALEPSGPDEPEGVYPHYLVAEVRPARKVNNALEDNQL